MSTTVKITAVRPFGLFDTVVSFEGIVLDEYDEETDLEVVVGVDHRPARELREALAEGEQPCAVVEDWQIHGWVTRV